MQLPCPNSIQNQCSITYKSVYYNLCRNNKERNTNTLHNAECLSIMFLLFTLFTHPEGRKVIYCWISWFFILIKFTYCTSCYMDTHSAPSIKRIYCTSWQFSRWFYFRETSRVTTLANFPLQFMSIYSNDIWSSPFKIAKLTPSRISMHLAKTVIKFTVRENNGI